jgi:hypothetical protein
MAAKASIATADATKKNARYLLASVIVAGISAPLPGRGKRLGNAQAFQWGTALEAFLMEPAECRRKVRTA